MTGSLNKRYFDTLAPFFEKLEETNRYKEPKHPANINRVELQSRTSFIKISTFQTD